MTMRSRWCLVLALLASACEPVDLTVVRVPDGGELVGQPGPPCATSAECEAGMFCEKAKCGDALGTCIVRPPGCDPEIRPQCGCDGITYVNGCYRRLAGVEGAELEPGACQPRACDSTTPCPAGVYCARIRRPDECGRVGPGQCVFVPETCMPGPRQESFYACGMPMTQCLDFCGAVRSQVPVARFIESCP